MTETGREPLVTLASDGGRRLYEQADELRAAGPAVRVRLPEGVVAWSVTRGEVIRRLLTHPAVTRNAASAVPGYRPGQVAWLLPWVDTVSMFNSEGTDHSRLRRLVGPVFSPRRVQALRPRVAATVSGVLDEVAAGASDGEPVDLRALFTHRVPTRVICDLFGVPAEQRPEMLRLFDRVLATDISPEEAVAVNTGLDQEMRDLIAVKRLTPGDDMASLLLAAHEEDGDRLTEQELIDMLLLMLGAGSNTAIALLTHAVRELLAHPGQLAAVLAEPGRWSEVIEETLRLHPAVMHMPLRWSTEDIDLGEGVVVRAGEPLLIGFGAHGRDPALHTDPAEFDLDRADKAHLAFGHGVHYCVGAPLARLEAMVALPALFARFPRIRSADGPGPVEPMRSFIANDQLSLPVRLGAPAGGA
jgi:2-hydroxy-5-methyl-1-naphthoate 7-hydroxylase